MRARGSEGTALASAGPRAWGAVGLGLLLGCGGLVQVPPNAPGPVAEAPPAPDPLEALVEQALEWEVMPGTTAEPSPGRADELRAFFRAHPEYLTDPAAREALADLACAFGVEEGHRRRLHPDPPAPLVVEVGDADWKVMVARSDRWCTSEDWSWFVHDVSAAVQPRVVWGYADPGNPELIVVRGGEELGRTALDRGGYLTWAAGREPAWADHDVPESVVGVAAGYFGFSFGE